MPRLEPRSRDVLLDIPRDWQIEQATEGPAADPHLLAIVEPQAFQPREDARQRYISHHRARSECTGAIMRAGAKGDALLGIAPDIKQLRIFKTGLVAIGRPEHEEHPILRLEIHAAIRPA